MLIIEFFNVKKYMNVKYYKGNKIYKKKNIIYCKRLNFKSFLYEMFMLIIVL